MHPDPHFRWSDRDALRAFVADHPFGMVFVGTPDGPMVAHVPVIWLDEDRIGFHVARGNRIAPHLDRVRALFVANGAHAYVSPDWYGLPHQVPTWNYVAVELEGVIEPLSPAALPPLIDALSEQEERRLAPKLAWTRDKMAPGRFDQMLAAISGHALRIDQWRGTRKLGQNKPAGARAAVARALHERGETAAAVLMESPIR